MTPKEKAAELIEHFMWCSTSLGYTQPLAIEVAKDIAVKHCELLVPYLEQIDDEFNSHNEETEFNKEVIKELKKY